MCTLTSFKLRPRAFLYFYIKTTCLLIRKLLFHVSTYIYTIVNLLNPISTQQQQKRGDKQKERLRTRRYRNIMLYSKFGIRYLRVFPNTDVLHSESRKIKLRANYRRR